MTNYNGFKIGFHVSISGSIANSVHNAIKIGCTAFQIFSRNPRGWNAKQLTEVEINEFKNLRKKHGFEHDTVVVHMPYLPNLSSSESESYKKSTDVLAEEVKRCEQLEIRYLVIHLGSHLGKGKEKGIEQLVNALNNSFDKNKKDKKNMTTKILLENSSGQKNSIGNNFEEIRNILDKLNNDSKFGVCFDTCHAFTSGYDLRSSNEVDKTLDEFENIIGFRNLDIVHLNDSKGELNSNKDRHEHIGLGQIGEHGLGYFINRKEIKEKSIIMETPIDNRRDDKGNLDKVLELIRKSNNL